MFESSLAVWVKKFAAGTKEFLPSCEPAEESILCKEQLLAKRLTPLKKMPAWKTDIENHSEDKRIAIVVHKSGEERYELASAILGWDAVLGKELFYAVPLWWLFRDIERGSLLAHSVELVKQIGLDNHFNKLYNLLSRKRTKADVYSEMSRYKMANCSNGEITPVTFDDSLLRESIFVLLYGTSLAALCFFAEILVVALLNLAEIALTLYVVLTYFKSL